MNTQEHRSRLHCHSSEWPRVRHRVESASFPSGPAKGPQPRRVIGHIGLFGGLIFSGPLDLPVTGSPICGKLNDGRANQDERTSIERKRRDERQTLNFGHDVQWLRRHGQTRLVAGSRSHKRGGRSRQGRRSCRRDSGRSGACRRGCRCRLRSPTGVTAGEKKVKAMSVIEPDAANRTHVSLNVEG
jgi:hypothetical protein